MSTLFEQMVQAFDNAQPGGSGIKPKDGAYMLEVGEVKLDNHPTDGYPFFATKLGVHWSENPGYVTPGSPLVEIDWGVWMKHPQKQMKTYMRDVKRFVFAVCCGKFNPPPTWEQVTAQHLQWAISVAQPLKGAFIAAKFHTEPQKHDPTKDFQHAAWSVWRGPNTQVQAVEYGTD